MRGDKQDLAGDSVSILGQFLDDHAGNRLILKKDTSGPLNFLIIEQPHGALVVRLELDSQKLWLSRSVFKAWIAKRFGSYTAIKNDLIKMEILKDANARKVLGSGTMYSGSQQGAWLLDTSDAKRLGEAGRKLLEVATMLEKDPKQKEPLEIG